jgi:hypothetical protein
VKLNRRHTKKRHYSKKSRRFKSNRKITRKHFKKQNKKYHYKMKGGMVFRGTDQGCSFWPSIYPESEINEQTVTKVFYNKFGGQDDALNKEDAGYTLFDTYDPDCDFHARKVSSGKCSTQILQGTECESDSSYRLLMDPVTKDYATTTYINTEYVGISLRTTQVRTKSFKIELITFFITLLGLRQNGNCLIFPDLNGGNVCYICNVFTQECTFKCIDVGGVFELNASQHDIEPRTIRNNIESQFNNIHYIVLEGLRNFSMRAFEYVPIKTYEDNLEMEVQKLQAALDYVTSSEETVLFKNQIEPTSSDISSRPKKSKKSSGFFHHNSDSDSGEGPSHSRFNLGNSGEGPPLHPSRNMFDSDDDEESGV